MVYHQIHLIENFIIPEFGSPHFACPELCSCHGSISVTCSGNLTEIPSGIPKGIKGLSLHSTGKIRLDSSQILPNLKILVVYDCDLQPYPIQRNSSLAQVEFLSLKSTSLQSFFIFKELHDLKILQLENNLFNKLTSSSLPFPNLERLYIEDNPLQNIEIKLKNLKHLDIKNTFISDISFNAKYLPNLEKLEIRASPVSKFKMAGEFSKLTEIRLISANLTHFSSSELNAPNLKSLILSHNPIEIVDFSEGPTSLAFLDLKYTNLRAWNATAFKLFGLTDLLLDYTMIESFEFSLAKSSLETLSLTFTPLQSFEISRGNLSQLVHLYLHNSRVRYLDLSTCTHLSILGLDHTNIRSLDITNYALENLFVLYLDYTPLETLAISGKGLPKLAFLHIARTKLQKLKLSLQSLVLLDATDSPIEEIDLSGTTNLKELILRGTRLEYLPSDMTLPQIEEIDLSYSKLKHFQLLPSPKLKTLILDSTKITTFDSSDFSASAIETISLSDCPLTNIQLRSDVQSLVTLRVINTKITCFDANLPKLESLSLMHSYLTHIDLTGLPSLPFIDLSGIKNVEKIYYNEQDLQEQKMLLATEPSLNVSCDCCWKGLLKYITYGLKKCTTTSEVKKEHINEDDVCQLGMNRQCGSNTNICSGKILFRDTWKTCFPLKHFIS